MKVRATEDGLEFTGDTFDGDSWLNVPLASSGDEGLDEENKKRWAEVIQDMIAHHRQTPDKQPETRDGKEYLRNLIFMAHGVIRDYDRCVCIDAESKRRNDPTLDKLAALHYLESVLERAEKAERIKN